MFKFKLQDIQHEEHYIPNWNFMLLCSSSSYKMYNVKNIIFQIGILCQSQRKLMTSCFSGWNCLMFRIIAGNCLIELNVFSDFLSIAWSWFIAQEWKQTDHRLIILLTKQISFIILGFKNSLSPSSEKKRRQRLKMSLEAKEAQREKSKVAMQTRRVFLIFSLFFSLCLSWANCIG